MEHEINDEIEEKLKELDTIDDAIYEIEQTISDKLGALQASKIILQNEVDGLILDKARAMLDNKPYKCGTVNLETRRHKIKTTIPKKVTWDQFKLEEVRNKIIDAGRDPAEFIKKTLSVTETDYNKFPEIIKLEFEPARTVEQGKAKIEIVRR